MDRGAGWATVHGALGPHSPLGAFQGLREPPKQLPEAEKEKGVIWKSQCARAFVSVQAWTIRKSQDQEAGFSRRHGEQACGHSGGSRGRDELREQH